MKVMKSQITPTENDFLLSAAYDFEFDGSIESEIYDISTQDIPEIFGIGLIVGKSGTGKSSNLSHFGKMIPPHWDSSKSIVSNFDTFENAQRRLHGCGLSSIKVWGQPYHTLSTGEAYRADIAKTIQSNVVYDEFCSYLDEHTSKSLSYNIRKLVDKEGMKNIVVATCRDEVAEWLQPDWVFDCNTGEFIDRRLERRGRPEINLEIHPCSVEVWRYFKNYHYLSGAINKGSRCWVAFWDGNPVGFYATLAQPNGSIKNGWRGSRLVVLPEFQGLGIGNSLCEYVASIHLDNDKRFFAKTASVLLGEHRERSPLWKPTSKNRKKRPDYVGMKDSNKLSQDLLRKHENRLCYSHEYIGDLQ